MQNSIISCQHLSKSFKQYKKQPGLKGSVQAFFKREFTSKYAIESFDLDIKPGEFVGLLGPNGAGKTTLMKMMAGIIAPSQGNLAVMGYHPFQRAMAFRKKIALVLGQKGQLWWDIPALDSFQLLQKYYEIPRKKFDEKLGMLSSTLDVEDLLQVHLRKLSLGERMKMELIACLLHDPDVIFLDEPTIGLDVVAQVNIRKFLAAYQKDHGTTIILTSHYMGDVDALCERIVLVLEGKKRFDGSISDFSSILGKEKFVTIEFDKEISTPVPMFESMDPKWNQHRTQVELRIPEKDFGSAASHIFANFPVVDFNTEKLPIERVMSTLLTNPDLL